MEDIELRLEQHLSGGFERAFTKRASDWQKFLLIEDLSYPAARQVEVHIKKMKSRKYLINLRTYEELRLKLIAKYSAGSSR